MCLVGLDLTRLLQGTCSVCVHCRTDHYAGTGWTGVRGMSVEMGDGTGAACTGVREWVS